MSFRYLFALSILLCGAALATVPPDLQKTLDTFRESQDVPGISAVVIRANEVVYLGGSGIADIQSRIPMTADTRLYIGSVTKVLTAVLALQLVETNDLSLDTTVDGISIGTSGERSPIRVSHLLTHSSGLEREGDFGYWFTADFPDDVELAQYLANAPLRTPPGTALHYSNIGYAALGAVIERALNQPFRVALRERVLEPLQMTASGLPGPVEGIANGYTPRGELMPSSARPFAGVGQPIAGRHERHYHDAGAMGPAFGAYTSARDMARLVNFLLGDAGEKILSPEMRAQMHTRQASGWGLGLKIRRHDGRLVARHDGWFAAHRAHLLLDMDAGIGVVVLANSDSASAGRIAEALYESVVKFGSLPPLAGG